MVYRHWSTGKAEGMSGCKEMFWLLVASGPDNFTERRSTGLGLLKGQNGNVPITQTPLAADHCTQTVLDTHTCDACSLYNVSVACNGCKLSENSGISTRFVQP